mgnify:CR=1 FL=1
MAYLKRNTTKYNILEYMLDYGNTSKVELSKQLNISMPTVLSNVNELMEKGKKTPRALQKSQLKNHIVT